MGDPSQLRSKLRPQQCAISNDNAAQALRRGRFRKRRDLDESLPRKDMIRNSRNPAQGTHGAVRAVNRQPWSRRAGRRWARTRRLTAHLWVVQTLTLRWFNGRTWLFPTSWVGCFLRRPKGAGHNPQDTPERMFGRLPPGFKNGSAQPATHQKDFQK